MATPSHPCAQYLAGGDPLQVLGQTAERLQSLVSSLGPARMKDSYAPGKWTLNAVVGHLADCELAFGYRWRQILAQPHHAIQPFDQDAWSARSSELDATTTLAVFGADCAWNLSLLELLPPNELAKPLMHPERGEFTLLKLIQINAGHDLYQISRFENVALDSKEGSAH
jgi:hypothetical protein